MLLDVTEWHDVAAGRGSLCDWMMEGAAYFSEIGNLGGGGVSYHLPPPTPSLIPLHLSKEVYLRNAVSKFSGSINTASCIMKEFLLSLLNLPGKNTSHFFLLTFV